MTVRRRSTPLFHLFEPSEAASADARRAGAEAPFSYAEVGGTRGGMPEGYEHDVQTAVLGHGRVTWDRAVAALRAWKQFDLPWIRFYGAAPLRPGEVVTFASWHLGIWSLNTCRVVEVIDEPDGPVSRFGFAYGTLAGHSVAGEERFELRWDHATDEVTFEIRKFSRLQHWAVRALSPVARHIQSRFSRDALQRLRDLTR